VEIGLADNYADILDPTDENEPEYLILKGGKGAQILVSIPSFSTRTITITTLPTVPVIAPPPIWVIVAAGFGVVITILAVVWYHIRKARVDVAAMLIERGLLDIRLAEVEIVGKIRELKEFTIPELIQRTGASKILAWRTVRKLMERGLVQPTEQIRAPLAGRGKPSTVYKYVGD
jgi:predicted transcriptional regulator